jgi:hypothetical protein
VDVKFEIAEYVQADEVGIYWELEPKVGELDQPSHSLQVLHSLALALSNSGLRHSVFLIEVALRRSVSAILTSLSRLFLDKFPIRDFGPGVEGDSDVGRHDSNY